MSLYRWRRRGLRTGLCQLNIYYYYLIIINQFSVFNMVSSLLVDALKDPTCSLLELYDPTTQLDAFPALVSSHFSQIFSSVDAFQEVCSSHRDTFTYPSTLLRFLPSMFATPQKHTSTDRLSASAQWSRTPRPPQRCTSPSAAVADAEGGAWARKPMHRLMMTVGRVLIMLT